MKTTPNNLILVFGLLAMVQINGQNTTNNSITSMDLNPLIGDWSGSLTYIDYSSNNPFSMPAKLNVKQGKNEREFILFISYPKEPKANGKEKIKISKKGDKLNNYQVISKDVLENSQIQIITEHAGKDNNKKATIRDIYILGEKQFIIRKEVQFENSTKWLKRNEYSFSK